MKREKEVMELLQKMKEIMEEFMELEKEYENKDDLKVALFELEKYKRSLDLKLDYLEDEVNSLKNRWED